MFAVLIRIIINQLCNSLFNVYVPHEYVLSTGAGTMSAMFIAVWLCGCLPVDGRYEWAQCGLPISAIRAWGAENISLFLAGLWAELDTLQDVTHGKSYINDHKGMKLKSWLAVMWGGQPVFLRLASGPSKVHLCSVSRTAWELTIIFTFIIPVLPLTFSSLSLCLPIPQMSP